MKNITKIIALAFVVLGFSVSSFGQDEATATASASIITPISIENEHNMDFGSIYSSEEGGTVELATTNIATGSGVAIYGTDAMAAQFTVTGTTDHAFTFAVTPVSIVVSNGTASDDMTVGSWSNDAPATLDDGSVAVNVGATLTVGANQPAGVYTSATSFTVTVCYE